MDPKEKREEQVRDTKRALILDAARNVFAEKGFHETRLEDIAERAGFSKASLYNYYKDKESLFLSLGIREHSQLAKNLENAVDLTAPFEANLRKLLDILFANLRDQFTFISSLNAPMALLFCHARSLGEERDALISEFKACAHHMMEIFENIVEAGRRRGDIQSKLETRQLANFAASLLRGVVIEWKKRGKVGDAEQEIQCLVEFIKHGFAIS